MQYIKLKIPEIILLEPKVYSDNRGFFFESFNHDKFEEIIGQNVSFTQDNHSFSHKGVLRGLHYQVVPREQGKLVRVVKGKIFDVAVDIRKNSPTFGNWVGEELSAENKKQLWIPSGFAHGFLALEESEVLYKATDYYAPDCEKSILWNDSDIGINWLIRSIDPIISEKDLQGESFNSLKCSAG